MENNKRINYTKLSKWLSGLSYNDFKENKVIKEGWTVGDIDLFRKTNQKEYIIEAGKITLDMIIFMGDKYIADIDGSLAVIELTAKKYKMPNGRMVKSRFIRNVCDNKHTVNGCWVIPIRFYE